MAGMCQPGEPLLSDAKEAVSMGVIKKQRSDKAFYFGISPALMGTDYKGPFLILAERKELDVMEGLQKCQAPGALEDGCAVQGHNNRVNSAEGLNATYDAVSVGQHRINMSGPSGYRVRKLTPAEYGRLQAFPMDRWEQVVSDSQAYKQFGNAVTVSLFSAIAAQIAKAIYEAEAKV